VRIERVTRLSPELAQAVRRLLGQLSTRSPPPDDDALQRVIDAPSVQLLIAVDDDDRCVGMLSLVLTPLPTGVRGRIEDVVVDRAARGRGAARMLVRQALQIASEAGARDVDLTARPERTEAVGLYRSLGFARRETDVYRMIPAEP
jgi:ribosomal protein S18 acetylase RimI-like enzyme